MIVRNFYRHSINGIIIVNICQCTLLFHDCVGMSACIVGFVVNLRKKDNSPCPVLSFRFQRVSLVYTESKFPLFQRPSFHCLRGGELEISFCFIYIFHQTFRLLFFFNSNDCFIPVLTIYLYMIIEIVTVNRRSICVCHFFHHVFSNRQ